MKRIDEPYAADERTMLNATLDWHRATVFVKVDDVPLGRLLEEYERQCARSTEIAGSLDLDAAAALPARRGHVTLRWLLLHMMEETARHNGHIDILREMLDGTTGG